MIMVLNVEKVYFSYHNNIEVLKGASFSVNRGEIVAIIGPNGSGKTTLLMIAAGLLEPKKGEVLLEGKPLKEQLPEARKKIGLIFQDPDDQLFNPTVYDEIAFALHQLLYPKEEIEKKVKEVVKKFNLENLLNKPPFKLSIGEKRMVTIASIIVYDPDILLFDEPTANLSSKTIEKVEELVIDAKNSNKAIVIASHDVEFIANVADRVYIINDGITLGGSSTKSILFNESLLSLADMKPPLIVQALKLLKLNLEEKPLTIKDLRKLF